MLKLVVDNTKNSQKKSKKSKHWYIVESAEKYRAVFGKKVFAEFSDYLPAVEFIRDMLDLDRHLLAEKRPKLVYSKQPDFFDVIKRRVAKEAVRRKNEQIKRTQHLANEL
jgi:hypothetical protein